MPIKAKYNGSYKDITDLMNVDESIDYVLAKTSSSYKRVYTATRSIEDPPPTTFKSIKPGANLTDYRIYGQTVDGKSVGDRTGNLFDGELYNGYYRANDGQLITDPSSNNFYKYVRSNLIPCTPQTTYTLKYVCTYTNKFVIFTWYSGDTFITSTSFTNVDAHTLTVAAPLSATKFGITISGIDNDPYTQTTIVPVDISNIMLNLGDTALPYEPYGYKVPVTVSDGTDTLTTNLYLPEQIRKVGNEAEYIDYGEQKFVKKFYKITLNFDDMNNDETFPGWSNVTAVVEYCNKIRSLAIDHPDSYTPLQYSSINEFRANFNVRGNRSILYLGASFVIGHTQSELKEIYAGQSITFILKMPDTELDVTLPALPTLPGTNVLSVGTEVQPSKIDITGHIKTISGGS